MLRALIRLISAVAGSQRLPPSKT